MVNCGGGEKNTHKSCGFKKKEEEEEEGWESHCILRHKPWGTLSKKMALGNFLLNKIQNQVHFFVNSQKFWQKQPVF